MFMPRLVMLGFIKLWSYAFHSNLLKFNLNLEFGKFLEKLTLFNKLYVKRKASKTLLLELKAQWFLAENLN